METQKISFFYHEIRNLPSCWNVYWCCEGCLGRCGSVLFLEVHSEPLGRNIGLMYSWFSLPQRHCAPARKVQEDKAPLTSTGTSYDRMILEYLHTLRRLKMLGDFLKASDLPYSSSLARVPSKWLLAHRPMPIATPWQQNRLGYKCALVRNTDLFSDSLSDFWVPLFQWHHCVALWARFPATVSSPLLYWNSAGGLFQCTDTGNSKRGQFPQV